jgi:hypothetical protein
MFSFCSAEVNRPLGPSNRKTAPARRGNGAEAVSGKVICPYERGVQRRGLPDRSDLFRANGGRVRVLKNVVIDHEIHDAYRERARHKQRSGKYCEVAFGEAVEHQISPARPAGAALADWFQGANSRGERSNLDRRLSRRWSNSSVRFRRSENARGRVAMLCCLCEYRRRDIGRDDESE